MGTPEQEAPRISRLMRGANAWWSSELLGETAKAKQDSYNQSLMVGWLGDKGKAYRNNIENVGLNFNDDQALLLIGQITDFVRIEFPDVSETEVGTFVATYLFGGSSYDDETGIFAPGQPSFGGEGADDVSWGPAWQNYAQQDMNRYLVLTTRDPRFMLTEHQVRLAVLEGVENKTFGEDSDMIGAVILEGGYPESWDIDTTSDEYQAVKARYGWQIPGFLANIKDGLRAPFNSFTDGVGRGNLRDPIANTVENSPYTLFADFAVEPDTTGIDRRLFRTDDKYFIDRINDVIERGGGTPKTNDEGVTGHPKHAIEAANRVVKDAATEELRKWTDEDGNVNQAASDAAKAVGDPNLSVEQWVVEQVLSVTENFFQRGPSGATAYEQERVTTLEELRTADYINNPKKAGDQIEHILELGTPQKYDEYWMNGVPVEEKDIPPEVWARWKHYLIENGEDAAKVLIASELRDAYRAKEQEDLTDTVAANQAKEYFRRNGIIWNDVPELAQYAITSTIRSNGGLDVDEAMSDDQTNESALFGESLQEYARNAIEDEAWEKTGFGNIPKRQAGLKRILEDILNEDEYASLMSTPPEVYNELAAMLGSRGFRTDADAKADPDFRAAVDRAVAQGSTEAERTERQQARVTATSQAKRYLAERGINWTLLTWEQQQEIVNKLVGFGDFNVGRAMMRREGVPYADVTPEMELERVEGLGATSEAILGEEIYSFATTGIEEREFERARDAPSQLIEEIAKERGILHSDTSMGYLSYFNKTLSPRIRARLSLIDPDDMDALRQQIEDQFDAAPAYEIDSSHFDMQMGDVPPGGFGSPGFRLAEPTPGFDVSSFTPELQMMAMDRPELAGFIQQQMMVPGFEQEWQQAAQRKVTRDRGADLSLQEGRVASFQSALERAIDARGDRTQDLQMAQARLREVEAAPGATEASINAARAGVRQAEQAMQAGAGGVTRAEAALADAQARAARETGVVKTTVSPTGEGQPGMFRPVKIERLEGETDEAFDRRQEMERLRTEQNLTDMAKMKTTAGLTQREFFEKQLPGFEIRFEASPFFRMEKERLEGEEEQKRLRSEQEERAAESRRRGRLRGGAMTVFGRRQ